MGYYPKAGGDTLRLAEIVSDDPYDGVSTSAVAARARRLEDPEMRRLIWFMHAMVNRDGGRRRVAEQLERLFPRRFDINETPRWLATICVDPLAYATHSDSALEALFEFQRRHREEALGQLVKTRVALRTLDRLNFARAFGAMVLIQGGTGIGKSTAARAWCEANLGDAHFVSLTEPLTRTTFFQSIARGMGLAAASTTPAGILQSRIEDILHACPLLMCFDECQRLWTRPERNRSTPELLEWMQTALYNHRVPVALVASPEFSKGLAAVEELSHWNSEQFKSRVRVTTLELPDRKDVESVAEHLLPDATAAMRQAAVTFALCTRHPMRALLDARDEATHLARKGGRDRFTARDLAEALRADCLPSEEAKGRMVKACQANRPRQSRSGFAAPLRPGGSQAVEDTFGACAPVNRSRVSGPELAEPAPVALA